MSEFIPRALWEARAWYYDGIPHRYVFCEVIRG